MRSLRASVIRLAYEHPEFRKDLLPVLKEAASEKTAGAGVTRAKLLVSSLSELYQMAHELTPVDQPPAMEAPDPELSPKEQAKAQEEAKAAQTEKDAAFVETMKESIQHIADNFKAVTKLNPEEVKSFITTFHDKSVMVLKRVLI